ncbi:MAG: hypothetical protein RLZZ244_699 [Verrucomicrobiota bacterium]|jgi:hypothetical protein
MPIPSSEPSREALELLCIAISRDPNLAAWFRNLRKLPSNLRLNAILEITSKMKAHSEDPALIQAVSALRNPSFEALVSQIADTL